MWKKLGVVGCLITLALWQGGTWIPLVVKAQGASPSVSITVTYAPFFSGAAAPTAFSVTRVNDEQIRVDWTAAASAENITIRMKLGSPPTSRTDGYEVYYGAAAANTANDTAVRLDDVMGIWYYRAWTQNGTGDWSTTYAEGNWGKIEMEAIDATLANAVSMGILFLAILALGLFSTLAWWRRDAALFALTAGLSLFTGFYIYDKYVVLLGLALALTLWGYAVLCVALSISRLIGRREEE